MCDQIAGAHHRMSNQRSTSCHGQKRADFQLYCIWSLSNQPPDSERRRKLQKLLPATIELRADQDWPSGYLRRHGRTMPDHFLPVVFRYMSSVATYFRHLPLSYVMFYRVTRLCWVIIRLCIVHIHR